MRKRSVQIELKIVQFRLKIPFWNLIKQSCDLNRQKKELSVMGGLFGSVSKEDCVDDLFYGTDYHSHLGTKRGGMAVKNAKGFTRSIHNIENDYFRSKFESDLPNLKGDKGIGVISDNDSQPLIIGSHLGTFAIVTVGKINNIEKLVMEEFAKKNAFFRDQRRRDKPDRTDGNVNL